MVDRREHFTCDVEAAVVGGGPAGLTAAIALAAAGIDTALIAQSPRPDNRTAALLAGSVTALESLEVWEHCRSHAAALTGIRLVDDTLRLLRAPEVTFSAAEIGLEAFGYNIENIHLIAGLHARAAAVDKIARLDEPAQSVEIGSDGVTVRLASGRAVRARLAIGADGRRSLCRIAAGIASDSRDYPQAALTLNCAHARPHNGISTEFHTESGPFTLVPLPGTRSSLVCVASPPVARRLAALDTVKLGGIIERRAHSILGKVTVEPGFGLFRLGIETARAFAASRVALIGEAAHVIPPIGAQGLNLGLRDAATIAELAAAAHRDGDDIGSPALLARYDALRRADVRSRAVAIDVLNRSLLSDFLPVHALRGLGLYLLDRVGPLRRAVMREGVSPLAAAPRLMRGANW
ncbi:MAG TPA: UbiH/UbiF family hydroxylase [Xanthobacteraceae bacterium]|nr:UbiH/UbiF family hydroxylase [Xanthobacteraceae bacterium]